MSQVNVAALVARILHGPMIKVDTRERLEVSASQPQTTSAAFLPHFKRAHRQRELFKRHLPADQLHTVGKSQN